MNRLKVFDGVPPPYDKVSYYVTQPIMISQTWVFCETTPASGT